MAASTPFKEWQTLRQLPVADGGTDTPHNVQGDSSVGSQHVTQWVWDPIGLAWVRMTQPGAESAAPHFDQRLDFTSGDLDYLGKHATNGASQSDSAWLIWKFTWASGNCTRIQGPLTGAWTNRASLSW
jgi:hypothetical protein